MGHPKEGLQSDVTQSVEQKAALPPAPEWAINRVRYELERDGREASFRTGLEFVMPSDERINELAHTKVVVNQGRDRLGHLRDTRARQQRVSLHGPFRDEPCI